MSAALLGADGTTYLGIGPANTLFWALIGATLVVAVADWVAVATDRRRVEYVLKPLTMVVLIAAALVLEDPLSGPARGWLVAGLLCSLAGDVFLMLEDHFVEGLAAFLVGHVAYVVALWNLGVDLPRFLVGVVIVAVLMVVIGRPIISGARRRDPRLGVPVTAYITVISLMVASAIGTGSWIAVVGAVLFYASDGVIGVSRFVKDFPQSRLVVMTTYHLGQIGLVLALV
ncbi:lysoplasmalogenase [Dermatobacter hominis]|uniref:lysoplasmalogenase n=1 Tax=Dermatobacter hominis TaxID=2884263 RepID=UPI001D0FD94F|nr:lysoplasmalogenase [Dermatobacter hominis]UDY37740.1 lysoplasmalogenase [Dermatobacter hominis]